MYGCSLSIVWSLEEELVDFYDWMVDSDFPNGLVVTDEMELIRQHPEYLELSSEPPEKQSKLTHMMNSSMSDTGMSAVNTPIVTDIGSEGESQAGQESAQRSPASTSPAASQDDDKDVDDLEDDILGDMETKPAAPGTSVSLLLCVIGLWSHCLLFECENGCVNSSDVVQDRSDVLAAAADPRQAAEVAAGRRARRERVLGQGHRQLQHCRDGESLVCWVVYCVPIDGFGDQVHLCSFVWSYDRNESSNC